MIDGILKSMQFENAEINENRSEVEEQLLPLNTKIPATANDIEMDDKTFRENYKDVQSPALMLGNAQSADPLLSLDSKLLAAENDIEEDDKTCRENYKDVQSLALMLGNAQSADPLLSLDSKLPTAENDIPARKCNEDALLPSVYDEDDVGLTESNEGERFIMIYDETEDGGNQEMTERADESNGIFANSVNINKDHLPSTNILTNGTDPSDRANNNTVTALLTMPKECKVTLAEHEITEFTQQDFIKKGDMIEEETPKSSIGRFRQQLSDTLHHHYFQIIICVLVLLDTAVVVTEIMVDSSRSHSKSEHLETAEFALHYVSLTILSIFMFEITLKIFAMGLKFLKHKFEIFDAIIVSVSFFLDVFLSSGGLKDGVEFLVLLRLWRITRIINGRDVFTPKLYDVPHTSNKRKSRFGRRRKSLVDEVIKASADLSLTHTVAIVAREEFTVEWITRNHTDSLLENHEEQPPEPPSNISS
uniref:Voltage-gated hydrogen channel 1 n=2 Tax=Clytia hemisphaerica TaxID=252671 RepID=A0A7M6DQ29_9CNID